MRIGIISDITDRKEAEDALKESEERFKSIVENSPSAFIMKDLEGRHLTTSPKFDERYGVSGSIEVKIAHELVPKSIADVAVELDEEVLATGEACDRETEVVFADGTCHWVNLTKFPIRDADGNTVALASVSTDVTSRHEAEEKLQQAQKMEAVGQLTGGGRTTSTTCSLS